MKTESEIFHMTMTIQRRDTIRSGGGILADVPGDVPGVVRNRDGQRTPFDSHRTGEMRIRRRSGRFDRFNRAGRYGRFSRFDRFRTDKTGVRCQTDTSVDRCRTDKIETTLLCGILCESVEVARGVA